MSAPENRQGRQRRSRPGGPAGPARVLALVLVVAVVAVVAVVVTLAAHDRDGSAGSDSAGHGHRGGSGSGPGATRPTPKAPRTAVRRAYDRMTPKERVGQLFLPGVASVGATEEQLRAIRRAAVGNAFLRGPSDLGVGATRAVTRTIASATTRIGVGPFVATDQEGGFAQSLKGPGFATLPTASDQGRLSRRDLHHDAATWAGELRAAGVTLDLAPVADVVPAGVGVDNAPIGYFHREYGATPAAVAPPVATFVHAMTERGVATTLKHFPGLGRASGNTDSDPDVTDPTTPRDALLGSFAGGIAARAPMVMVSSAFYPGIDDGPRACFDPRIIRGLLRGALGFDGVVVSDSFGSASVASVPPARRALLFFRAGGTLLLDTDIDDLAPMTHAVLAEAERHLGFARTLRRDVLRVLAAKDRFGLLVHRGRS